MNYVRDVKQAYYELIVENDWLDPITKNKALLKLNATRVNVGYPDWVLNANSLDNYYQLVYII